MIEANDVASRTIHARDCVEIASPAKHVTFSTKWRQNAIDARLAVVTRASVTVRDVRRTDERDGAHARRACGESCGVDGEVRTERRD